MKKTIVITFAIIIAIIAIVGYLRFVVGGDEDTWLCEDGQWVRHGNPTISKPTAGCEPEVTEYLACGCGCCGSIQAGEVCLYSSKGDDIQEYIDDDKKKAQSSICATVGCSSGVLYRYCDGDKVTDNNASNPIDLSNQFNWSTMNQGPYNDSVTYALSNDLINWNSSGIILAEHASVPGVVIKDGTIFVYFVDVSTDGIKEQLGMVKSTDEGQTWSEPTVLTIEGIGDRVTADPAAVITNDGQIRLYYFDINEIRLRVYKKEPVNKIYSAISDDGVNFTQEEGVRFEREGVFDPDVLYADGTWYMYTGDLQGNRVLVATSSDGLTFTYQGVAYEGGAVPDVWHEDGNWYLYTAGINIATGTDGLTFESTGKEFRDPNSRGTADPSVVKLNDGSYLMLYKVQ